MVPAETRSARRERLESRRLARDLLYAFCAALALGVVILAGFGLGGIAFLPAIVAFFLFRIADDLDMVSLGLKGGIDGDRLKYSNAVVPRPYGGRVSPSNLALIASMAITPRRHVARVRETVTLTTKALRVRQATTFAGITNDTTLLPVALLNKGVLVDDFELVDESNTHVPTLTYPQSVWVVRMALREVVRALGVDTLARYVAEVEAKVMRWVEYSRPLEDSDRRSAAEALDLLHAILGTSPHAELARRLAASFFERYPIFAECDFRERPEIFSVELTLTSRRIQSWGKTEIEFGRRNEVLKNRSSVALGVRPGNFLYPLDAAGSCGSYHLEFFGPEGTYLAWQEADLDGCCDRYRFRSRSGQRYGHLYVSGATDVVRGKVVRFLFFERMPGSVGPAAISALASTVLIFAAGFTVASASRGGVSGGSGGSDVMALLLAFPGIAASWVGLDRSSGPVGGVLVSRVSSGVTLALSLASAAIYLWSPSALTLPGFDLEGAEGVWGVLVGLSSVNFLMISVFWHLRARAYALFLRRGGE